MYPGQGRDLELITVAVLWRHPYRVVVHVPLPLLVLNMTVVVLMTVIFPSFFLFGSITWIAGSLLKVHACFILVQLCGAFLLKEWKPFIMKGVSG